MAVTECLISAEKKKSKLTCSAPAQHLTHIELVQELFKKSADTKGKINQKEVLH